MLKTKLKGNCPKNKQELETAAVEAWQSFTRAQTQRLVMSVGSRLQAVIDCKGFAGVFYFKSIVEVYRAKMVKIVSVSKYISA